MQGQRVRVWRSRSRLPLSGMRHRRLPPSLPHAPRRRRRRDRRRRNHSGGRSRLKSLQQKLSLRSRFSPFPLLCRPSFPKGWNCCLVTRAIFRRDWSFSGTSRRSWLWTVWRCWTTRRLLRRGMSSPYLRHRVRRSRFPRQVSVPLTVLTLSMVWSPLVVWRRLTVLRLHKRLRELL